MISIHAIIFKRRMLLIFIKLYKRSDKSNQGYFILEIEMKRGYNVTVYKVKPGNF